MEIMTIEEAVRKSAQRAYENRKTINDCPDEFLEHVERWQHEFKKADFDPVCAELA